jgi:hypothetical protein
MPELTPEMHAAMAEAIRGARRYLIANFPKEGEGLLATALTIAFTDTLGDTTPAAQAA